MSGDGTAMLEVEHLTTLVHGRSASHPAVDDVSFTLRRGETLGLVGESGSGKSLTALSILGLNPTPATAVTAGRVVLDGTDLRTLSRSALRRVRGKEISIILQDPTTALNPVWSVGEQIGETIRLRQSLRGRDARRAAVDSLRLLQVADPELRVRAYPHQLSGGMRQRVVGAIALSCGPSVLIADEPTTALDVTVQAAFLAHLRRIQAETGVSILFITHDFGVVATICDRVGVMYAGQLLELGTTAEVLEAPRHPYTQALVRSVPNVRARQRRLVSIPGHPPSVEARPAGCPFHERCWLHEQLGRPETCRTTAPAWTPVDGGREVRCHFAPEAVATPLTVAAAEAVPAEGSAR